MIDVPGTDYIHFIKTTGNYQVSKKIKGKQYSFGTYDTLDEALFARDYFQENNWDLRYRLQFTKTKYIKKLPSGRYQVIKQHNGTQTSYGTFDTITEAEYQVQLCKRFQWDIRLKPFDCMKHIIKMNDGRKSIYRICHEENGRSVYYGAFNNLLDAQFERDLLILSNWDIDNLCEFDESLNGEKWLDGKMMKCSFQKRIRNDYFLAKNGGIL